MRKIAEYMATSLSKVFFAIKKMSKIPPIPAKRETILPEIT